MVLSVERKRVEPGSPGTRGSGTRCGDTRKPVVESAGAQELLGSLNGVCARGATVATEGWSSYVRRRRRVEHIRLVLRAWKVRDAEMESRRAA